METLQQELFYEDINSALHSVIAALGGPKKVGVELWPMLLTDFGRYFFTGDLWI